MFNRDNPFGARPPQQAPSRRPVPQNQGDYRPVSQDQDYPPGYSAQRPPQNFSRPQQSGMPDEKSRFSGPAGGTARPLSLQPARNPGGNAFAYGNLAAVSPQDFPGGDQMVMINANFVIPARPHDKVMPGQIGFTEPQRKWMNISLGPNEYVDVTPFRAPVGKGPDSVPFIGRMDVELSWYSPAKTSNNPIHQMKLVEHFLKVHDQQILSNGQLLVTEFQGSPAIRVSITHLAPIEFGLEERSSRALRSGVITAQTEIKVIKTTIPLVAADVSAHQNAILRSDFSFQELGIGGLDREFEVIFRRAFASRLFPAPLIERMGIQHVRGLLLFGPPGTGKTLIARQIGKTLNAREPKIVNGPELLNKYVGQSEENVRKVFEDAEKEYKEKGDASGLHIVIFDELDAVCKQRGSGSSGGTGVGDNIVNQMLTKLDGVEQLNNLLLIGMTNRKDLIDEALLRPGRLEVHLEISLPDEAGRLQIFKIHTSKLLDNNLLGHDVSLEDLAARTRNYSGAEISGVVRLASSFAFARHTEMKDGKGPKIDDVESLEVVKQDFEMALADSTPMFGTAEEDLMGYLEGGIFDYSDNINRILKDGIRLASIVQESRFTRLSSLLLYGPPGSGKTALAAAISRDSGIPFVKVIKRGDLAGLSDLQKIQAMQRVFMDADKTPQSVILIDDIEKIFEYVDSAPPRFIASVLSALGAFMSIKPPKQRRRLIIATTSNRTVLGQLGLLESFESEISVPNIESTEEIGKVFRETGDLSAWQIDETLRYLRENPGPQLSIGVKRAVAAAQVSRQDKAEEIPYIVAERVRQMMVHIPKLRGDTMEDDELN